MMGKHRCKYFSEPATRKLTEDPIKVIIKMAIASGCCRSVCLEKPAKT